MPPGGFPLSLGRQLRVAPDMTRVLAAAPRSILRLVPFMAGVNKVHPAQPYWYLEVVGVDPGAGKAVADDINAAVESAEGASWGR